MNDSDIFALIQHYVTERNDYIKHVEETRDNVYRLRQVLLIYIMKYNVCDLQETMEKFRYYDTLYECPQEINIEKLHEQHQLDQESLCKIANEAMDCQLVYTMIYVHKERTAALIRHYETENNLQHLTRWKHVMRFIHSNHSYLVNTDYSEIKEIDDEIDILRYIY